VTRFGLADIARADIDVMRRYSQRT